MGWEGEQDLPATGRGQPLQVGPPCRSELGMAGAPIARGGGLCYHASSVDATPKEPQVHAPNSPREVGR